ncbi:MAG: helix-turn-helix transcriptional regulator [Cyclobacteriaceae bacterium]
MNSFGYLIRTSRESLKLPLRKVAAELDIDTSILSKIERGERNATPDMIPILSEILNIEFKSLQVLFLSNRIFNEFGEEKHIMDGLNKTIEIIKNSR